MTCTDTITPFVDERCPRDATDVVWIDDTDAPFCTRSAVCKEHARIFRRMAAKFFPTKEAHCEPIAEHPTLPDNDQHE